MRSGSILSSPLSPNVNCVNQAKTSISLSKKRSTDSIGNLIATLISSFRAESINFIPEEYHNGGPKYKPGHTRFIYVSFKRAELGGDIPTNRPLLRNSSS